MSGTTILRGVALGFESVAWGTLATRTIKLMEVTAPPSAAPQINLSRNRSQGSFAPATTSKVNKAGAALQVQGHVTFEDLPLWAQAAFGLVVPSPNSTPYPRLYDAPLSSRPVPHPYSAEVGEPGGGVYTLAGIIPEQIQLKGNFDADNGDWTMQANCMAKSRAPVSATNEVQTVTITGTPAGGTFKLAFEGVETTALPFNETSANVQIALRALASIGSGNVTVSGSSGGPYTVTFVSALANSDVPLLVLTDNSLTGGSSPTVTIVESTRGGGQTILADRTVEKVGMDLTHIYIDALGGTIGTTEITAALIGFDLTLMTSYHAKFFAGSPYAQGFGVGPWDVASLKTMFEYTAAVKAFVDNIIQATKQEELIRIKATGSGSKEIDIDGAYTLLQPPPEGDRAGNTVITLDWGAMNSVAAGYWHRWTVKNALATLAA